MIKKIRKQSALDLEIKGSIGAFSVGDNASNTSVRVQYLQTHVSLATGGDHQEKLLKMLAPVREVFETKRLDFEQIMQRDIHDARVSTELIPYLLEEGPAGLVKLFPPIIVVVLPTTSEGLPADYYPVVTQSTEEDPETNTTWKYTRSGDVGSEVFEFRQVVEDGEAWDHDYARLKINTTRSALVIIDGQHRAMALIALYRNIKGWPDKAKGVEPYYKLWSPNLIKKFDLSSVKLPVMFCAFPQLDGTQEGLTKVHAACRSVFLALNKNARKVTDARNYLLDDRDIISALMRSVLTMIKNNSDSMSESTLRLWNVELDADEDRVALVAEAAVTGVMHIFGLIQYLMLGSTPGASLSASRQHLSNRNRLDQCFKRLHLTDTLPKAVVQEARRDSCDPKTRDALVERFNELYGSLIVKGLSDFAPYAANNRAAFQLNSKLSTGATAEFYRGILFEGQGMERVFREFIDGLTRELRGFSSVRPPEMQEIKKEFKERNDNLKGEIKDLERRRLDIYLEKAPAVLRTSNAVRAALREAYSFTFTTAAFQSALFITFFAAIDEVNEKRSKPPTVIQPFTKNEVHEAFGDYLKQINEFFSPSSKDRLTRLLSVFCGRVVESGEDLQVEEWASTLRSILIPGELKPDEWAKFRVILVELWKPAQPDLKASTAALRKHLRKQALDKFTERRVKEESARRGLPHSGLPKEDVALLEKQCAEDLLFGLQQLGGKVTIEELRKYQAQPEEAATLDPEAE